MELLQQIAYTIITVVGVLFLASLAMAAWVMYRVLQDEDDE